MATPQPLTSVRLLGMYQKVRQNPRFLTQLMAPSQVFADKDWIEFGMQETATGMAPFVRSNAPGIPTRGEGWETKRYRPAYIKMRDGITVSDNQPIWYPGEQYPWSTLSYTQKFNLQRSNIIARHSAMKEVREEYMLTQVLREGKQRVQFQGRLGQPEDLYNIDYGRAAALDVTPSVLWDQPTATPVSDLEGWFQTLADEYEGVVTTVLMGREVAQHLVLHEDFNDMDKGSGRILSRNFDTSRLTYNRHDAVREYGTYRGVTYLSYSGRYHKSDGTKEPFIKGNELMVIASKEGAPRTMMLRGRIRDLNTLDRNIDLFQKEKEVWDPSGIDLLSQASLLAATTDANFALRATVLA